MKHWLIEIRDTVYNRREFINAFVADETAARAIGENACALMYEDYHDAPTYFVANVSPLD